MAWTTPLTAVANATLTAAQWNASVRDNLAETAAARATAAGQIFVGTGVNSLAARVPSAATVMTSESTTSTSYTALATPGPAVTVTTGTQALVIISSLELSTITGGFANASYAVSGSTTIAAGTGPSVLNYKGQSTSGQAIRSLAVFQGSLTGGSNTFTMQYNAGSAGGTATFLNRHIIVFPL